MESAGREELWKDRLSARVRELAESDGSEKRRAQLLEWSAERGVPADVAEHAYDLAVEEGVDPGLILAVIDSGVGVQELESPTPITAEDTHSLTPPDWVDVEMEPKSEIALERRLRNTSRRLRADVERFGNMQQAVDDFIGQPDVGPVDYWTQTPEIS